MRQDQVTRRHHRDNGFSFIELLAYMAIAALLILAALPQFGQYRDKATVSTMLDDAKTAGQAYESLDDPTDANGQAAMAGLKLSSGDVVSFQGVGHDSHAQLVISNPKVPTVLAVYSTDPDTSLGIQTGVNLVSTAPGSTYKGPRTTVFDDFSTAHGDLVGSTPVTGAAWTGTTGAYSTSGGLARSTGGTATLSAKGSVQGDATVTIKGLDFSHADKNAQRSIWITLTNNGGHTAKFLIDLNGGDWVTDAWYFDGNSPGADALGVQADLSKPFDATFSVNAEGYSYSLGSHSGSMAWPQNSGYTGYSSAGFTTTAGAGVTLDSIQMVVTPR